MAYIGLLNLNDKWQMGFKCHMSLNGWLKMDMCHQMIGLKVDMCHKKSFSCTCGCICNFLYEYEWMKNTNISYVHRMYNMLHATRCRL